MNTQLVKGGEDYWLPNFHERSTHTRVQVYSAMFLQVCRDYSTLPDLRTLSGAEIRFFYNGLRPELKEGTKPKK